MTTKKLLRATLLVCLIIATGYAKLFAGTVIVNSNISTNTTWTNSNQYVLVGIIYVTNNATLTINAGTIIQGDSASLGSLVITRGAKLMAVGTACQPIVFTSEKATGKRKRGDWGGVILEGNAQVNWPGDTAHIEGIVPNPNTLYGGGATPNNADNSGTLKYVRIEFAGVALSPNNEINGLTMGGVGSGTTIEHIQVSYSNDDSYEWFGGTVNCKWLVAYDGIDDDFDTDNGFSGKVQFGLGMRDPNVADVSGSKSFESDNDPTGSTNLPQTSVVFNNMTCLGGSSDNSAQVLFKQSAHIRRNSNEKIYNSIMMGFPQGILVDGSLTIANCAASSFFDHNYVQQASGNYRGYTPSGDPNQAAADANLAGNGNIYSTQYTGVIADPDFPASSASDFIPSAGNPLPSSNNTVQHTLNSFFTNTTYVGAFNPAGDNWAGDWTNFDPVNTTYGNKIANIAPAITVGTITPQICPNSGAIDITPTGGKTPYSYSWSNGATTQDISGLAKGNYVVTVFDAGGACSASKTVKVAQTKPILTSCTATSTTITVFWSGNIAGAVTGYQIRNKKHTTSQWGPWTAAGNGTSKTVTGLLSNTQYDFQLRGTCTSGNTSTSATLTCSTTLRLENETAVGEASISVFPNPTSGEFKVELNGFTSDKPLTLKVTNVLGQVVFQQSEISTDNSSVTVNLSDVSEGMYSVEVSDGVSRLVQSIIVNK